MITLIATYTAPATGAGDDWLSRLGTWWLSAGLGAFWWPGLLVSLSIVAAVIAARRGGDAPQWTPRAAAMLDRDSIRRPLYVLAIAGALVGIAALVAAINLAKWWPGLPQPLLDAFAIDEDFLATRAPWALVLWAAAVARMIAVLIAGRWGHARPGCSPSSGTRSASSCSSGGSRPVRSSRSPTPIPWPKDASSSSPGSACSISC